MSRLHAVLLTFGFVVLYVVPVSLALIFEPFVIFSLGASAIITYIATGMAADDDFYLIPVTYKRRALNRKHKCYSQAHYLHLEAQRCRKLAKTYEDRKQFDEAAMLKIEAEHRDRWWDLRMEQAEMIQREIQDREMAKLMGGA